MAHAVQMPLSARKSEESSQQNSDPFETPVPLGTVSPSPRNSTFPIPFGAAVEYHDARIYTGF